MVITASPWQDANRLNIFYKMTDSLIVGYLRKRGYVETERSLLQDSPYFRNYDPTRPILINTTLNDKNLEEIIEIFFNYGRFDVPPEMLGLEQQLRDFSNSFTNFVVNYSRSNQQAMMDRQRRMHNAHQLVLPGPSGQRTVSGIAQTTRRGFTQVGMPSCNPPRHLISEHVHPTAVPQSRMPVKNSQGNSTNENPQQQQRGISNNENVSNGLHGQVVYEEYSQQGDQQQMDTGEFDPGDNNDDRSARRKPKAPHNEYEIAARAFSNIIENAQTAQKTASMESVFWDNVNFDMMPLDDDASCRLLLDYVNAEHPTSEENILMDNIMYPVQEQMDDENLQVLPTCETPPVAETVTVEPEHIEEQEELQSAPPSVQFQSQSQSSQSANVSSPPPPTAPAAPLYAPRKMDALVAFTSESTNSYHSAESSVSTEAHTKKPAQKAVSMDDLFGDGAGDSGKKEHQEKSRKSKAEMKKPSIDSVSSKGDHQHRRKEFNEKSSRHIAVSPRPDERPPSVASNASSSSPRRHESLPPASRRKSPERNGSRRRSPSVPKARNDNQPNDRRKKEPTERRNSTSTRNRRGETVKAQSLSRRRSSAEERPPSRSGEQKEHRGRSPDKKQAPKNKPAAQREKKEEIVPKSILSKKATTRSALLPSTMTDAEEDVLSSIASNMDNLRKPEKKDENPFPSNPMFGFPITPKMPTIRIPKLKTSLTCDKKSDEKKVEKEKKNAVETVAPEEKSPATEEEDNAAVVDPVDDEVMISGFPSSDNRPNLLIKGTISDSRVACMLSAITEKRAAATETKRPAESPISMSQLYESSENYDGYHATVEKPPDTSSQSSAKRRKLDKSEVEKILGRIHGSTP